MSGEITNKKTKKEHIKKGTTKVVPKKIYRVISILIVFLVMYFAVVSGSVTLMWAGLGLIIFTSSLLFVKN